MASSYTPTYYSSLHDSITSICKNILPFSFKKKRLPAIAAAEQRLAKQQSDNLKWQQESFHQILNLMGLCKEGILHESEVSAFRTHLLEALVAMPLDYEAPVIVRDKLIFLQELLYSKCISEDEYHKSKMPLLQMLAVQGAEIRQRDVVDEPHKQILNEEWPVIDSKENKCLINSESLVSKNKLKEGSTTKKINSDLVLPHNNGKLKEDKKDANDPGTYDVRPGNRNISTTSFSRNELIISTENPFWTRGVDEKESESKSILMMETLTEASVKAEQSGSAKGKRKPFRALFQRDQKTGQGGNERDPDIGEKEKVKPVKKTWGFDGFKKWKKSDIEDETAPLSLNEKSDGANRIGGIVASPVETKQMKKELHTKGLMADSFPTEVLGEDLKEELSRIQTELRERTARVHLSGDQNGEISTQPPVDNAEPKKIFQKSWSNQHGDSELEVAEKEFKVHNGEWGNSPSLGKERQNSKRWTTFDDEENSHPNLFAPQASLSWSRNARTSFNNSSMDKGFRYNPFFDM